MLVRFCGKMTAGLFPLVFLLTAHTVPAAQETNGRPILSETVITNMAGLWTLPPGEKSQPHRIRMELLIYYCDTNWNVFWGDRMAWTRFFHCEDPRFAQGRRNSIH